MTAPYSSTLLREAPATRAIAPRPVYAAPMHAMPAYAPAPIMVRPRNSRGEGLAMLLIAVLVALGAGFAAYEVTRNNAPTAQEMAAYPAIANQQGYLRGRLQGTADGRAYSLQSERELAYLKAQIARQQWFNRGYNQGKRLGAGMYSSGYGGYRGYGRSSCYSSCYRSYGGGGVQSALATAQNYANATGSPVDVTVY